MLRLDTVESMRTSSHQRTLTRSSCFLESSLLASSTHLAREPNRVDALTDQFKGTRLDRSITSTTAEVGLPTAKVLRARRRRDVGTLHRRDVLCGVASVRRHASRSARWSLFVAFGLALLFPMGALGAFLIEMLLASRGLRDQANCANWSERRTNTPRKESASRPWRGGARRIDMRIVAVIAFLTCSLFLACLTLIVLHVAAPRSGVGVTAAAEATVNRASFTPDGTIISGGKSSP